MVVMVVFCAELLKDKFDGHLLEGGQRVRVIDVIKDPKARKDELKHANVFIQVRVPGAHLCQHQTELVNRSQRTTLHLAEPTYGNPSPTVGAISF